MQRDGMYVAIEPLNIGEVNGYAEMTRLLFMLTLSLRLTSEEGRVLSRKFWFSTSAPWVVVLTSSPDAPTSSVRYQLSRDKSISYTFRIFHLKVAVVGQCTTSLIVISIDQRLF